MRVDSARRTAAAVREGRLTAAESVERSLRRIAELDGPVNAFTVVCADAAREAAAAIDRVIARGEAVGPLAGVPIAVKDHVWVAGLPATNGSRALADFVPEVSCACVDLLVDAGAVIVGKTNNPEFCYRGVTDNELWGLTRNPRDPQRTAGGSSGGSAAAVAAGMVPLAVGTDGGGSIRIPSAFCGTSGLKPTFGMVATMPGFRGWPTLSVTGPMAADVGDLALMLSVMAGPAARDPRGRPPREGPDRTLEQTDAAWAGLRVAVSDDLGFASLDADVRTRFRAALDAIADAGAEIVEAQPATVSDPVALWDSIAVPEGYASEGPLVESCPELVGADAASITLAGRDVTAREYLDAQYAREAFADEWLGFFDSYDVLLCPTMPTTAFETGRLAPASIGGHPVPPSFDAWCALALPANLAGLPAATVPIGDGRDGLPVGLQAIGARRCDRTVLRAAAAVERAVRG